MRRPPISERTVQAARTHRDRPRRVSRRSRLGFVRVGLYSLSALVGLVAGVFTSIAWLVPERSFSLDHDNPGTRALQKRLAEIQPRGSYLVVDTRANRFVLHGPEDLAPRTGSCSTGSSKLLRGPEGQVWRFETPVGLKTVRFKSEYPVWKKPDWAFVEEGEPIPAPDAPERFEAGVLGRYALALGEGYYIHGSPYTSDIGESVTHGCVRLLDDDLEAVYKTLEIGDSVVLF